MPHSMLSIGKHRTPAIMRGISGSLGGVQRRAVVLAAALVSSLSSASVTAMDVVVTGDAGVQGYEVAGPWGDQVLNRRRMFNTIGIAAYNLEGDARPQSPDFSIRMRLRVDADFGISSSEAIYDSETADQFVPGLQRAPVDFMVGYIEGRHLAGGLFDFKLGRQYTTDVLGWWSFDGALFRVVTPLYFQAEVFGGLEQRGGSALSTSRWEAQGVYRGSHSGFESQAHEYPSFQYSDQLAPAFGLALETNGSNSVHGRLTYRRVYTLSDAFTQQFPSPDGGGLERVGGMRISQERIGYGATAFLPDIGGLRGGFVYDLYSQLISRAYGGLDVHLGSRATISGEVDFFVPTFDADSIWNWFTHNPTTTVMLRGRGKPLTNLSLGGSAGTRMWLTDGDAEDFASAQCAADFAGNQAAIESCLSIGMDPTTISAPYSRQEESRETDITPDLLLDVGAEYRWATGRAGFQGSLQSGFGDTDRGRRVGGGIDGRQRIGVDDLWLNGRVSLYEQHDPLRDHRDTISFGYVLAPEYSPLEGVIMTLEWEHDMNELVGQRTRLLGLVSVSIPRANAEPPSGERTYSTARSGVPKW